MIKVILLIKHSSLVDQINSNGRSCLINCFSLRFEKWSAAYVNVFCCKPVYFDLDCNLNLDYVLLDALLSCKREIDIQCVYALCFALCVSHLKINII